MKLISARTLGLILLVGSGVTAQVAYFPDNVPSTGGTNTIPYRETSWGTNGYTSYHVYPAATLTAAGVPAGAVLTGLAVAPSNASGTSGTINISIAQVYIGHLAVIPPTAGQWLNNVSAPVTLWNTAVDGPLTFSWVADNWAAHPIACHGAGFVWNGVTDVVFYQTHAGTAFPGGGWTGGFGVHTSPSASYIRHGYSGYNPTIGTAPTTTGTAGMRIRLTFGTSACFGLSGTTSGGGVGDVSFSVSNLPAGVNEGFTLVTSSPVGAPGTGPLFGIWPDALTWQGIASPAAAGNPIHFVTGVPGTFPQVAFTVPPGTLSFLAGQVWDAVLVALAPGLTYVGQTNVVRLTW